MASGWTNYAVDQFLNTALRGVAFPTITNFYYALFTATPSDTGGGTECTGGGYARVAISVATGSWAAASGGSTSNSSQITVTSSATGSFGGSVTQFGLYDASSSGNLWFWGDLSTPQTVASGNPVNSASGATVIGAT